MSEAKSVQAQSMATVDLNEYTEQHGLTVGFKIPPNGHVEVKGIRDENGEGVYSFRIISVCLGVQAVQGERALLTYSNTEFEGVDEIVCASLSLGVCENYNLDVLADGDFVLGNVNAPGTWIHVVGRVVVEDDAPGDEMDEVDEMDEMDVSEMSDYDDDSAVSDNSYIMNEDWDDESDEDDDLLVEPPIPRSTVKIEELPSDDEEKNATEQPRKKTKVTKPSNKSRDKSEKSKKNAEPVSTKEEKTNKQSTDDVQKKDNSTSKTKHDATKATTPNPVIVTNVMNFITAELKKGKAIKGTEMGLAIANKFGMPLKKMGLEEKTLSSFIEAYGKDKVYFENDTIRLRK